MDFEEIIKIVSFCFKKDIFSLNSSLSEPVTNTCLYFKFIGSKKDSIKSKKPTQVNERANWQGVRKLLF